MTDGINIQLEGKEVIIVQYRESGVSVIGVFTRILIFRSDRYILSF